MNEPKQASNIPKLMLGFCVLISIFLLFGVFTLYDIHRVSDLSRTIYNHPLVVSNAALQANVSITKMHRSMKDVVLFHSPARIQQSIKAVREEEELAYQHLNRIKNNILGAEGRTLESEARKILDAWRPIRNEVIGLVFNDQRENAANITIGKGANHVALLEEKMLGLTNYARNKASEFTRKTEQVHSRLNVTAVFFLIAGVLTSLLVALLTVYQARSAEKSLQASEERYRSLVETQTDLVSRFSPDGKFVFVNDMFCQFFNKPKKELVGFTWEPLPVDDDIEIIKEKLATVSAANPKVIIENKVLSGKGQVHWVQFINHGFFNHKGDLLETQSVGRDITERKMAELALQENAETLKQAQSVGKIGSWWYDPATQIPTWTEEMFHIFGLEPQSEAVPYEDHQKIIHPEDWDCFDAAVTQAVTEGIRYNLELRAILPAGEIRYINARCVALKNDEGVVTQLIGTTQDITKRKRAELALSHSEQKYRSLFENSNDGIILHDLDGTILDTNRKIQEMLNYGYEELNGMTVQRLHPASALEISKQAFEQTRKNGSTEFRSKFIKANGSLIDVAVSSSIIDYQAGLVQGLVRDITAQKKLEAQLHQAQKMESIGNLAGGIAHDFNNILSSIMGFTELALDDVAKETTLEDNLQEVYTAGKRARELVKQILAFARQSDEEQKPIQVDTIAKEVLKFIRSTIPTTIEIRENIESRSQIMGNSSQVHQIFMNLCTNAAHAMEAAGGILEVSVTNIEHNEQARLLLSELTSGDYLEITVSDTGPGILPDIIGSVFEPYFTTKNVGEGTGMGLATVDGIVKSYGGKITVDSKVGQGTVFSIYLPITNKREAYRSYEKEELPSGTERILFVDDELPIAKMGRQVLERLGYRVTVRTSSVEALELFRSKPEDFDLVITDMTMPNMNGDELAMELIAFRSDIPVILCTGYSKKIIEENANKIGIKAFIYKPVVKADLAKTVRKILDGNQANLKRGRILIVDDEPGIRKLFSQKLSDKGYEIIEAANGKEGLKRYGESPPDLVITDIVMPQIDGIGMIMELKRQFSDLKVIVISGGGRNSPESYLDIAKNLGALRTFAKPLDWPQLLMAIDEILS